MNSPDYKALYESWSDQYLKLKALYTSQSIALDKAEQEIKQLQKALKESVVAPEWQPIDYSQSESGKAPFDGENVLVLVDKYFIPVYWNKEFECWCSVQPCGHGTSKEKATHWMPVPEFMKG